MLAGANADWGRDSVTNTVISAVSYIDDIKVRIEITC